MARYLAKQVVARGWAGKALIQLAYAIGVATPVSFLLRHLTQQQIHSATSQHCCRQNLILRRVESSITCNYSDQFIIQLLPTDTLDEPISIYLGNEFSFSQKKHSEGFIPACDPNLIFAKQEIVMHANTAQQQPIHPLRIEVFIRHRIQQLGLTEEAFILKMEMRNFKRKQKKLHHLFQAHWKLAEQIVPFLAAALNVSTEMVDYVIEQTKADIASENDALRRQHFKPQAFS
jgi:hypothetical protein